MHPELTTISAIYQGLLKKGTPTGIPVSLRSASTVGTIQDDPFDCWVEDRLKSSMPATYEIYHSGPLTTPDLVIRNKRDGIVIGLEIKKLIQRPGGKDPRGITIDYNSCLPCGRTMIKVGSDTVIAPCYYLFALLSPQSDSILTLVILDGDFLNYDFELYKEAKYSNFTEYNHGPYGEGSVRHRKMYTYPNPLNSRLECFRFRQIMVLKKSMIQGFHLSRHITEELIRTDKFGNSFHYSLVDINNGQESTKALPVLSNIFDACKKRNPKERVAYIPEIPA